MFKIEKFTEEQKTTLEKYTSLIHLTLNLIGLTSLENFPHLDKVQIIELNNNKLTGDDLDILLKNCPKLYKIKLENNCIDSIDKLKCLSNYKIKKINLLGNPFLSNNEKYRDELFELIPSLESIDDKDRQGENVESTEYNEEEDGEFDGEGEEEGDLSEEDEEYGDEDGEGEDDEEDEEDDEDKPQKKTKK